MINYKKKNNKKFISLPVGCLCVVYNRRQSLALIKLQGTSRTAHRKRSTVARALVSTNRYATGQQNFTLWKLECFRHFDAADDIARESLTTSKPCSDQHQNHWHRQHRENRSNPDSSAALANVGVMPGLIPNAAPLLRTASNCAGASKWCLRLRSLLDMLFTASRNTFHRIWRTQCDLHRCKPLPAKNLNAAYRLVHIIGHQDRQYTQLRRESRL